MEFYQWLRMIDHQITFERSKAYWIYYNNQ